MWTFPKEKTTHYIPESANLYLSYLTRKKTQHKPCSGPLNIFKYFSVLQSMVCTPFKHGRRDLLKFLYHNDPSWSVPAIGFFFLCPKYKLPKDPLPYWKHDLCIRYFTLNLIIIIWHKIRKLSPPSAKEIQVDQCCWKKHSLVSQQPLWLQPTEICYSQFPTHSSSWPNWDLLKIDTYWIKIFQLQNPICWKKIKQLSQNDFYATSQGVNFFDHSFC